MNCPTKIEKILLKICSEPYREHYKPFNKIRISIQEQTEKFNRGHKNESNRNFGAEYND